MNTFIEGAQHLSISDDQDQVRKSPLPDIKAPIKTPRRWTTLYDAVEGTVTTRRRRDRSESLGRDSQQHKVIQYSTRDRPLRPDEALFRLKWMPDRYEEDDWYRAHERDLPHAGRGILPETDLLNSILAYSGMLKYAMEGPDESRSRSRGSRRGRTTSRSRSGSRTRSSVRAHSNSTARDRSSIRARSTSAHSRSSSRGRSASRPPRWKRPKHQGEASALLALGILLEEAGRNVLGSQGDLVFTEGLVEKNGSSGDEVARRTEVPVGYQDAGTSSDTKTNSRISSGRLRKKRRLVPSEGGQE